MSGMAHNLDSMDMPVKQGTWRYGRAIPQESAGCHTVLNIYTMCNGNAMRHHGRAGSGSPCSTMACHADTATTAPMIVPRKRATWHYSTVYQTNPDPWKPFQANDSGLPTGDLLSRCFTIFHLEPSSHCPCRYPHLSMAALNRSSRPMTS